MTVQLVNSQVVVQPVNQQVVVQVVQGLPGRSLNNRGNWVTATPYAVLDFFRDTTTNKLYSVLIAHTSTSVAADLAASKINEMLNITQIEALRDEAVTKAGEALDSANASEVSRQASGVSAGASEASRLASVAAAAVSEEAKVIAIAQADAATAQAVIADAQALIATNKAAEAAASAASITPVPDQIHGAATKATPVDADELALADSAASFGLKNLTWANLKATLLATWKDATGGLVGLTLFKINFKNAANTFTSFFANANTASRTYTFQDRDGTIADDTDLAGKASLAGLATQTFSVAAATSGAHAARSDSLHGKNILINGGFTINQRSYVSAATLAAGDIGHDRWKAGASGGNYSFTQGASNTTITIAAGKSLKQAVEAEAVHSTAYVLSWEGSAQARYAVNSATPAGAYAASPIVITGQTVGATMSVEFNEGSLGKAQLEAGSVPTQFESRPPGIERYLCQRDCEKSYGFGVAPGTATEGGTRTFINSSSTNSTVGEFNFKVPKRTAPTSVTIYSPVTGASAKVRNEVAGADETATVSNANENGLGRVVGTTTTAQNPFRFHFVAATGE